MKPSRADSNCFFSLMKALTKVLSFCCGNCLKLWIWLCETFSLPTVTLKHWKKNDASSDLPKNSTHGLKAARIGVVSASVILKHHGGWVDLQPHLSLQFQIIFLPLLQIWQTAHTDLVPLSFFSLASGFYCNYLSCISRFIRFFVHHLWCSPSPQRRKGSCQTIPRILRKQLLRWGEKQRSNLVMGWESKPHASHLSKIYL